MRDKTECIHGLHSNRRVMNFFLTVAEGHKNKLLVSSGYAHFYPFVAPESLKMLTFSQ